MNTVENEVRAWGFVASAILAGVVAVCSGCAVTSPTGEGHVAISGDARGIKAFYDGMNGMITNGKASPDQDTAHWQMRKLQEKEETKRKYAPSFLDKLFGNDKAVPQDTESNTRSDRFAQGGAL